MAEALLELKNICKQFDGNAALSNASFCLYPGEVHALVGENGAGKSTLMNILAGICKRDSGEIFMDGQPVEIESVKQAQSLGIASILQNYDLFEQLDIAENLFINQEPVKKLGPVKMIDWNEAYKRAQEVLKYLNINIDPRTPVSALSPGVQKFVEIARTIVYKCRIIIMDEPTNALTEQEVDFLFDIINNLKAKGVSIIYISHRLTEVWRIADRITILRDGSNVETVTRDNFDSNRIVKMIVGEKIRDRYPKLDIKPGKELFIVKNLSSEKLIRDISFSIRKGEILGVTGLKGSGKSELGRVLFGAEPAASGNIYVNGRKVEIKNTEDAANSGICYVPANRIDEGLVYKATVSDNIVITRLQNIVRRFLLSAKLKSQDAVKYVKMMGIKPDNIYEDIKNLSGGNQKKVILAKWLFNNSRVLILNEPTSSIDVSSKIDIYNILNKLLMSGSSIMLISSEIPELIGMCDRILVMYRGRVVKELARGEATQEQILYYASGGQ